MTEVFSLWSCKHQTMESIIPEEGFKRQTQTGFFGQLQDFYSFHPSNKMHLELPGVFYSVVCILIHCFSDTKVSYHIFSKTLLTKHFYSWVYKLSQKSTGCPCIQEQLTLKAKNKTEQQHFTDLSSSLSSGFSYNASHTKEGWMRKSRNLQVLLTADCWVA